ncbi:SDR family oxidoreductase [Gracilinema caldarium]|uniref:SDR family oxidoreductase n=1 Tax=Gracilinema caldarium TaxID=215591 RepID=UPI0026F1D9CA|nr:SDR family oxidoreductase [Gracilinema caldarium]
MKQLQNKIVLVTGGTSGIGRLVAIELARQGALVVVWDISEKALAALEQEAKEMHISIQGMLCDVSDREAVYRQSREIKERWGPVSVLVNNAGVVSGSTFLETSDEKIEKTMAVNTMAHFWTLKAVLPDMIARNEGHIVTIASAAGIIGVTGLADYSASKFAAFGLHEAIRMELRRLKKNIQTTVVCPFFIDTGMFAGVRTRFPLLLPILKSEYAAQRIVQAIKRGKKRLIMPRFVYSVYLLRLLPVSWFDGLADFFGVNHAMDHFKGRS